MLTELNIENFRLFKKLELKGLRRINLFAGKNNTGKTALLEALRIIAADAHVTVVNNIIARRGQLIAGQEESYESLFNRNSLQHQEPGTELRIRLGPIKITKPGVSDGKVKFTATKTSGTWGTHIPFDHPKDGCVFVPFGNESSFPLQQLWDGIVLTPAEDDVVSILQQTILPDIKRVDIREDRTLVRLSSEPSPIPLKNLGDGAQRLLLLAIALVSAKGKMLLIDEIEAGLHYTVQEQLWSLIFEYAEKWDIQVFVTTHSQDTVKSFTHHLEQPGCAETGAYFRLQKKRNSDDIEVIPYDLERLELTLDANLEPR
ncbi:MAG: AAA family ATPase [Bacteroidetes bacterium]|nr:AAA family ATPase [Bacteroidota bacterium]